MHGSLRLVCALVLAAMACVPASAGLFEYVAQPDPAYQWSRGEQETMGTTTVITLSLTSQVWHGRAWTHVIQVFIPAEIGNPDAAALYITGGAPNEADTAIGLKVASLSRQPFAILFNIPDQPDSGPLSIKDGNIGYTFQQYLETGDETWPLLVPMTKAAVKAMDALQEFAKRDFNTDVETFIVAGGSKRGWTAWLTAAVDPKRVKGVAPMVIDTLDFPAQFAHKVEVWGAARAQLVNDVEPGLEQALGQRDAPLVKMLDPYSYRDRLTMPKLIINATNDPFWALDSLNLYWDGLTGPKWVLYSPNSGHGLNDRTRALNTLGAFIHATATGGSLPAMSWKHGDADGRLTLTLDATPRPTASRLWVAHSEDLDFRDERWEAAPMSAEGNAFVGSIAAPTEDNVAFFGEAEFDVGGRTFTLSTQVRVAPKL
jgi:PhoPQ-activated pathogenicity-related protein